MHAEIRASVYADAKGVHTTVSYFEQGRAVMSKTRHRRWDQSDPREIDQNLLLELLTNCDNTVADWISQCILF